jgi:hypothetical protein
MMITRFEIVEEKNPRRISPTRALISANGRCYFLQQQQQPELLHSLPLELSSFGGVCAVAVPINATRLRINKRYFIKSSF